MPHDELLKLEIDDGAVEWNPETEPSVDAADPVSFQIQAVPGRVKAKVSAIYRGETVCVNSFDPSSSKARRKFAEAIVSTVPDLDDAGALADLLMQEATKPSPEPVQSDDALLSRDELLAEYDEQVAEALKATPREVIAEAEAMLDDSRLIDRVIADIASIGVVGEQVLALSVFLLGVSRLLVRPLAGIIQGTSSSGKSWVIERVSRLFPELTKLLATDLTPQSLFYFRPGRLLHKVIFAGEKSRVQNDDRAEATRALREMISSRELRKMIPYKNAEGKLETAEVWQPGPIAHIESTTLARLFDEDANRCLLLGTDESPEQTARIIKAMARQATGESRCDDSIVRRHHAMQLMLKRVRVDIPYANRLGERIPVERPEARRAIGHILGMIEAVAILYQRQRSTGEIEHGDTITATIEDYVVARRLLTGPLGRSLGGSIPDAVQRFGERLTANFPDGETFTPADAAKNDPIITSRSRAGEYLRRLEDAGVVEVAEPSRGPIPSQWRICGAVPLAGAMWLPSPDDLTDPVSSDSTAEATPCQATV